MADQKISAMTAATTPLTGAELVPLVQGGANVQTPVSSILGSGGTPNLIQNYGGVAPVVAGAATGQFATDDSSGKLWQWNGSAWKNLF